MTARGSHRPSLRTLTKRALVATLGDDRSILVATSGGPDSQALLHVLATLRGDLGLELHAHGVDHGLRKEAAIELDLAEALARDLEVPFARTHVSVDRGGNLQARARDARYDALRRAARKAKATVLATAHHADDRAETVLQRLVRATSLGSLGVLPPRAGDLVRPLLGARKSDVELHLKRHALAFAVDPSNADPRFLRTRVRRELLPLLSSMNPRIVDHLCALADEALDRDRSLELGKPTRDALYALIKNAAISPQKARKAAILLPGGLVLGVETPQAEAKHRRSKRALAREES
ncbi:hypothetical protein BH09MYX1_BH09MYX1_66540 [soil metagenome]